MDLIYLVALIGFFNIDNFSMSYDVEMFEPAKCGNNYKRYRSSSMSMFPYILPNTSYQAEHVFFDQINIGDVIIYKKENKYIHHAVVRKESNQLWTKGYNNKYEDKLPVKRWQIVGRDCIA